MPLKSENFNIQLYVPDQLDTENISDDSDDNRLSSQNHFKPQSSFLNILRKDASDLRVDDTMTNAASKLSISPPKEEARMRELALAQRRSRGGYANGYAHGGGGWDDRPRGGGGVEEGWRGRHYGA